MHRTVISLMLAALLTGALAPAALAAKAHFDVQGMVCESCAEDIRASLSKLSGIQGIAVDLKNARVTVDYDPRKAHPDQIIKAIDGYGFEVKLIKQPPKSKN